MNVSWRNGWTWLTALALVYATISPAAQPPAEWRRPPREAIHHDVVILNGLVLDAIRANATAPALASRNLAIIHLAMVDAYVHSAPEETEPAAIRALPAGIMSSDGPFMPQIASAAAFDEVASLLFPTQAAWLHQAYSEIRERFQDSDKDGSVRRSQELGRAVGRDHLKNREDDGASRTITFVPSQEPGHWRRTPPRFRPPETTHWGTVRPFFLITADQFRAPPPPPMPSQTYQSAVAEVFRLGGIDSGERTAEESETAYFWSCFSYTATPPGHWNLVLGELLSRCEGSTSIDALKAYAILNVALADAAIACWDTKYHYRLWRPFDAVSQRALAEKEWESLLEAPPHPEYVSGHSTFAGAGAAILTEVFGTDQVAFTTTSDSVPGIERHYQSFTECAKEMGRSRILGGIHFSFSDEAGRMLGRKVGGFVCQRLKEKAAWKFPLLKSTH